MSEKNIIVIEGPSGAGKGTAAWLLAKRLKYLYVDTGAIYRGLAVHSIESTKDIYDSKEVCQAITQCDLKYQPSEFENTSKNTILVNDKNITSKLRLQPVSMAASIIAGYPCVVNKVNQVLQKLISNQKIVAEGQTIAQNLIPNYDLLIYLTASTEIRAKRRYKELKEKNPSITYDEVAESMQKRDHNDKNREFNKMKVHPNAHIIDSSQLTIEEVVELIYKMAIE